MGLPTIIQRQAIPTLNPIMSKGGLSAFLWVEIGLSTVVVITRIWAQYRMSKWFHPNDYLIMFALVCHITSAIVCQLAIPSIYQIEELKLLTSHGGVPSQEQIESAGLYLKYQFALLLLLWTTLWTVKFSLLLFFWRMFDSVRTHAKIYWWIMLGATAATYITTIFIQLFACDSPVQFFVLGGCSSERHLFLSNLVFLFSAGSDIAGDILLIMIPFPLLHKLNVGQHQKFLLVAIFLLPLIPVVFGILRLVFCNPTTGIVDVIKFQLYSMLENTAAVITACIPALRLFVAKTRETKSSTPYYSGNNGIMGTQASKKNYNGAIPLNSFVAEQRRQLATGAMRNSNDSREPVLR